MAHGEQWVPEHRVFGRRAPPEPRGPRGVGGAAEVVGNDGEEGLGVPRGGEWDGQTGVCRAAVCLLTQN